MSAIDAFYSTWSQARETFGSGVPQDGSEFDKSNQLRQLQSTIEAAKPDSRWQGPAADAYAAKNQQHAATYGKLAELDQRMAAEVSKTAGVVTAGRQNLDQIRDWVTSAAASAPNDRSGETMKVAIASKGIGQISEIIKQSNDQMNAIGERIRGIGREYDEISGTKASPAPAKHDDFDLDTQYSRVQGLRGEVPAGAADVTAYTAVTLTVTQITQTKTWWTQPGGSAGKHCK